MGASADDVPKAYRNSTSRTPGYTAFLFINLPDGKARAAVIRGLNFGLAGALITALLHRLLMPVHSDVDDYQVPELDFERGGAVSGVSGPAK